jgi:uncharacterized damage-inducible protein DinB
MSSTLLFETLFSYHFQTINNMLEIAGMLTPEVYHQDPGYGRGSLHDLFFHLLRSDTAWREGLQTGKRLPPKLELKDFPDSHLLINGFLQERASWEKFFLEVSPDKVDGDIQMIGDDGEVNNFQVWRILQHVILHGMQHMAEIAELLTSAGQSPGNIDFIFYDKK